MERVPPFSGAMHEAYAPSFVYYDESFDPFPQCLSYQHIMSILSLLFSFKGRISRKLYWLALLGVLLLIWILFELGLSELTVIPLLSIIALQVKRSRDVGWSPWLVLIALIPTIQIIFMINVGIPQSLFALIPVIQAIFMIVVGIPQSRILDQGYGFNATAQVQNSNSFRIIQ